MDDPVLRLDKICKAYNVGLPSETKVLHDVDLTLKRGEFLALMGPSGSGKSTLLNIIGLLDRPTSGHLFIKGQDTATLGDAALTRLRGHTIGFVFQDHHLISAFTAAENVLMPLLIDRDFSGPDIVKKASALLARVGLTKVADNRAANMSGGQQQRVAIARALAMSPDLVLADEPTGNLDTQSANSVFDLMRDVNRESGTTILMVTHNLDLAKRCDRIVDVVDGRITSAIPHKTVGASPNS